MPLFQNSINESEAINTQLQCISWTSFSGTEFEAG